MGGVCDREGREGRSKDEAVKSQMAALLVESSQTALWKDAWRKTSTANRKNISGL